MKFKGGILFILVLLITIGVAWATIQAFNLSYPTNNLWTNNNQSGFIFQPVSNINTTFSCELFIDDVGYGINATTSNNTQTTITANASLSDGSYNWYVNCTDANGTDKSTTYVLNVDTTNPSSTINSPSDNSWGTDTTPQITFTLTDTADSILNYTVYVDDSSDATGTANNNTATSVNLSALSQGSHTVKVEAKDEALNKVNSSTLTINVDSASPTADFGTNPVDNYNSTSSSVTFEIKCTDNNPDALQLWGDWTGTWAANQTNSSPTNNTVWSIAVSGISDGTHTWGVYCNDSAGNDDWSDLNRTLTVDTGAPTITAISTSGTSSATTSGTATITATTNEAATCWYQSSNFSAADTTNATQMSGNGTASSSFTVDYSSDTTIGPYYISCRDTLGHNMTSSNSTGSISVSISTSTSSSSGGGGSARQNVQGQFAKKTWGYLAVGAQAEMDGDNEIGLTKLRFRARNKVYNGVINVYQIDSLPSTVNEFDKKSYKFIEIKEWNLEEENIEEAKIEFSVAKTWLAENQFTKENMALFRYVNSEWAQLTTAITTEDTDYVYYTAETPGFSYFLIGATAEPLPGETATETAPSESTTSEGEAALEEKSYASIFLIIVIVAALAALIYFYLQKKKTR